MDLDLWILSTSFLGERPAVDKGKESENNVGVASTVGDALLVSKGEKVAMQHWLCCFAPDALQWLSSGSDHIHEIYTAAPTKMALPLIVPVTTYRCTVSVSLSISPSDTLVTSIDSFSGDSHTN